jgi:peptidoglycan/xylan/chitin deacetylase (PgdA/CDA1 family)
VVLALHQVSPRVNPFWSPLHPRVFEELLAFLTRHFEVCTFRSLEARAGRKPAAVLSFDDGYHDFVEYVMPALARYRVSANLNVVPRCLLGHPLWERRLTDFLNSAPSSLIGELRLPGLRARLAGGSDREKMRYALALSRYLKSLPRGERRALWEAVEAVIARADCVDWTRMMGIDDVLEASAEHEIGAHSYAHDSMGSESEGYFRKDLRRCCRFFRDTLGLQPDVYAFPNDSFLARNIIDLRSSGFRHILVPVGSVRGAVPGVFMRHSVYGLTGPEVRMRVVGFPGALRPVHMLRRSPSYPSAWVTSGEPGALV